MVTRNKVNARDNSPAKPSRPRGRPRPEHAAELEHKLLAVALQEFLQHGYGAASMTRIVQAAGVSKTTLYSRYASKEALFRAIMSQQIEYLSPSASLQSATGPLDLEQGLVSYAGQMLQRSLQGDLLGVNRLIYSESSQFPELGVAAAERTELGIKRIAGFIGDCAERDGIPCKDPDAVAAVFIFMIRGWYANIMLTNRKVTARERERWVQRAVHTLVSAREAW